MIFEIGDVPIYFPYETIYPEQLTYIKSLLASIQAPGHILIEMPSGTGKTIALLSCTVSYSIYCQKAGRQYKIVYCSRTIPEIDKALKELKNLVAFIKRYIDFEFLGFGLSRRANMCINEYALKSNVEITCRRLVSKFDGLKCDFYEHSEFELPGGVYDFEDLKALGRENGTCPYFLARRFIPECNCIIYPYNYLIDPVIYSIISENIPYDSFVIFDEAHNIDSHCVEALSLEINRNVLEAAGRILKSIEAKVAIKKSEAASMVVSEFDKCQEDGAASKDFFQARNQKVDRRLKDAKMDFGSEEAVPYYFARNIGQSSASTPHFYSFDESKYEFTPGNLRNSNHFISVMKRLIEFLKTKLKTTHLTSETIKSFTESILDITFINKKTLQFCSQRLNILINTLQIDDDEIGKVKTVAKFATMLSMYSKGFAVIFEPYDSMADVFNPILRLYCMDASVAMRHIFNKFRNVIITSGTLSPIDMYPQILDFTPSSVVEIGATLNRNSISPLIITKGDDQMLLSNNDLKDDLKPLERYEVPEADSTKLTTSFRFRVDSSVVRNYGSLLINLAKTVPDNIVVFFPSYIYMEEIVTLWSESNIINDILKHKLVFLETPDFNETEQALKNYRKACENGRGAILISVARGKVSEGVDFEDGYGRAVVVLGIPFMYTESIRLKERLRYLKSEYNIKEYDFLIFDAMRHTAQCLGRVLRKKTDYGLMIMADHRFGMEGKIAKMPKWIQDRIERGNTGLSIDMSMHIARQFFREMGQPFINDGICQLDETAAKSYLRQL